MHLNDIFTRLKRFDAYPKTLEDFRVKTFTGAAVTILSSILIVILFVSELKYYLSVEIHQELFVDTTRDQKIQIEFSITIPKVPCHLLTIDAMDVSGEQQIDVAATLFKQRLDENGTPLKEELAERDSLGDKSGTIVESLKSDDLDPNRCESCYGAETEEKRCCNTCEDVRNAYKSKGWVLRDLDNVLQCVREGFKSKLAVQSKEGCFIHGSLKVNKVAGNFHIAPGKSFQQQHAHVHDMQELAGLKFNMSHHIHKLSFGDEYPSRQDPLEEVQETVTEDSVMYQYFLKIVPTLYQRKDGVLIHSNQYSVTKHKKVVSSSLFGEQGLPGIFFMYELSPMMVKYEESQRSFMHFLTSVCAIIGGIFTVASLFDAFIYHSSKVLQQKMQLGKLS